MLINRQTLKSLSRGLYRIQCYCYSTAQQRMAIFHSQYQVKGPLDFKVPRQIQHLLAKNHSMIVDLKEELETNRKIVLSRVKDTSQSAIIKLSGEDKQIIEKYTQIYANLTKVVSLCPLNSEYIFKLIGWYNMIGLYKSLVGRLIEAEGEELLYLVESLSWMKHSWKNPYGIIDQDLFDGKNVDNFYKRLSDQQLPLSYVRLIQNILVVPINYSKRVFFSRYFKNNVDHLLKLLSVSETYTFSDIVWLMHSYVKNMSDQQGPIGALEKYIITNRPHLQSQDIEHLMDSYQLKGGINPIIYKDIIKPYIYKNKMSEIGDVIELVKFAVCSECNDNALIKTLYELIQVLFHKNKITASKHMYTLHLYTHYLLIKGYKINFSAILSKQMTNFCKQRSQGRNNVNKIVYDSMKSQKKTNSFVKQKYVSECLNTSKNMAKQFQPTKKSQFQKDFGARLKQFNLKDCNIYEKPIFCCFELDYCLHNKTRSQLFDIQIQGIQYVFSSGKLVRERQIKDEILSHYKIKINHIDYNYLRRNKHMGIDDVLMFKRSS